MRLRLLNELSVETDNLLEVNLFLTVFFSFPHLYYTILLDCSSQLSLPLKSNILSWIDICRDVTGQQFYMSDLGL
jgi:hypothetical protein